MEYCAGCDGQYDSQDWDTTQRHATRRCVKEAGMTSVMFTVREYDGSMHHYTYEVHDGTRLARIAEDMFRDAARHDGTVLYMEVG